MTSTEERRPRRRRRIWSHLFPAPTPRRRAEQTLSTVGFIGLIVFSVAHIMSRWAVGWATPSVVFLALAGLCVLALMAASAIRSTRGERISPRSLVLIFLLVLSAAWLCMGLPFDGVSLLSAAKFWVTAALAILLAMSVLYDAREFRERWLRERLRASGEEVEEGVELVKTDFDPSWHPKEPHYAVVARYLRTAGAAGLAASFLIGFVITPSGGHRDPSRISHIVCLIVAVTSTLALLASSFMLIRIKYSLRSLIIFQFLGSFLVYVFYLSLGPPDMGPAVWRTAPFWTVVALTGLLAWSMTSDAKVFRELIVKSRRKESESVPPQDGGRPAP